ncbi:MAG: hypothetical protein R3C14_06550 [Caldilineaceae bacterium]
MVRQLNNFYLKSFRNKILIFSFILTISGLLLPHVNSEIYSRYLLNQAALLFAHSKAFCSPSLDTCVDMTAPMVTSVQTTSQVAKNLNYAKSLLQKSIQLNPSNGRSWSLLSVIGATLLDKETTLLSFRHALDLNTTMPMWKASHDKEYFALANLSYVEQVEWSQAINRIRIQHHMLRAEQYSDQQEWTSAVQEMRLGFALAGEDITPDSLQLFYTWLANSYAEAQHPNQLQLAKALQRAGEVERARVILEEMIAALPVQHKDGEAYVELGWSYWKLGRKREAIANWTAALEISSSARACFALAFTSNLSAIMESVCQDTVHPHYILGAASGDRQHIEPYQLTNGAQLIGYDVDEDLLELGPVVELLLWWQLPPTLSSPNGVGVRIGDWWIQRYTGYNLVANAGFEWPGGQELLPTGYESLLFGTQSGLLRVESVTRNGASTKVLIMDNATNPVQQMGILGEAHKVYPNQLYLMAGWEYESLTAGYAGCWRRGENLGPYYFEDTVTSYALAQWTHYATAAYLNARYFPNLNIVKDISEPIICRPIVLNFHSSARTMFDDVFIVRLRDLP